MRIALGDLKNVYLHKQYLRVLMIN